MKAGYVRVGEVLSLARRTVSVDPGLAYAEIGIKSFGRGIFHKPQISGAELGAKRVYEIHDGDLVISNVFAWEGAVAVARPAETGRIGSHRFMTWVAHQEMGDARYLYHYFTSDRGLQQLQQASPGSAGRNRTLGITAFEDLVIPLPRIDEQRAIAAHLDAMAAGQASLSNSCSPRPEPLRWLPALLDDGFSRAGLARVRADRLFTTVTDIVQPDEDPAPADKFVGLENIARDSGRCTSSWLIHPRSGRKLRFLEGDVLYGYLRPYLNKAWAADGPGLCSVEQYVLRPQGVTSTLLSQALRCGSTLSAVKAATHRLQLPRIRISLLAAIPIPDVRQASPGLARELAALEEAAVKLGHLYDRQGHLRASLLTAARNEVFSKLV